MPEFKNKEDYEKWKAEKAKGAEKGIQSHPEPENSPTLPNSMSNNNAQTNESKKVLKSETQTKKSIARGGLIILASLFIGVTLMIIAKTYNDGKSHYLHGTFDVFFTVKNASSPTTFLGERVTYVKVKFPIEINESIIEGVIKRDFKDFFYMIGTRYYEDGDIIGTGVLPEDKIQLLIDTSSHISAFYDENGNKLWQYSPYIGNLLGFSSTFFFVFFPLIYLLFKFVTWAIRTLRKKDVTQV